VVLLLSNPDPYDDLPAERIDNFFLERQGWGVQQAVQHFIVTISHHRTIIRGSTLPDYLTKRNGFWQFVRRVPLEYSALDTRSVIKHSTKVDVRKDHRGIKARKIADVMNRELEAYWRGLSEGKTQEAAERYAEARRRARTFGFDYAETTELANRSTLERLERLEKLVTALAEERAKRAKREAGE
jgi:hypothetical protein